MTFRFTSIGNSSAVPAYGRIPSAHILNYKESYFLFDCAEGTQMEMMRLGIRRSRIRHIFISHLHGDHFLGLPGLLNTLNLLNHQKEMHVYAFPGLKELIDMEMRISGHQFRFPLHFHDLEDEETPLLLDEAEYEVRSFPLVHRIPCRGFLFREKMPPRKIRAEKLAEYAVPVEEIEKIRSGSDFLTADGRLIPNEELTREGRPPRSFAYVTDTLYLEALAERLQGVDLLYHEATFMEKDAQRAEETCHSTAAQAARIASMAGVKKLVLGHFSAKYRDLTPLLDEARKIFPETYLSAPGLTFDI